MVDFILSNPVVFRGATVLELGAGTGLTSIITATIAKTVYCTGTIEARTLLLLNTANNIYKVTATYRMLVLWALFLYPVKGK